MRLRLAGNMEPQHLARFWNDADAANDWGRTTPRPPPARTDVRYDIISGRLEALLLGKAADD